MRLTIADVPQSLIGALFLIVGFVVAPQGFFRNPGDPFGYAFMTVWSLIWFGAASWFFCVRFLWSALLRSRTTYGLTREGNALIVRDFMGPTVKTIYLPALSTIGFTVTGRDEATITFGEPTLPPWWNSRRGPIPAPAFEYLSGASKVYDLIQQLQQGRRTT